MVPDSLTHIFESASRNAWFLSTRRQANENREQAIWDRCRASSQLYQAEWPITSQARADSTPECHFGAEARRRGTDSDFGNLLLVNEPNQPNR